MFIGSSILILGAALIALMAIINNGDVNDKLILDNKNLHAIYKYDGEDEEYMLKVMSFQQGYKEIDSEIIEIVNKSEFSTEFSVCIRQVDVSSDSLGVDKVYFKVDEFYGILGDYEDGCVAKKDVSAKGREILDIKIWIGEDLVQEEDLDKDFKYKFHIK